jgi:Fe-S oxidoreductase
VTLRTRLIAYISVINSAGSAAPFFYNFLLRNKLTSGILKKAAGFASERSIPLLYNITLKNWIRKNLEKINPHFPKSSVCLFIDEFTNYNDTETGIAVIRLLTSLNYKVVTVNHKVSARTYISKGLLRTAQKTIRTNIQALTGIISDELPLIGIEPSAILGFRDEYPELAGDNLKKKSELIAENTFMVDEFLAREFRSGKIDRSLFVGEKATILLHAHCQQKAISSSASSIEILSIPENYSVKEIPSGCCGMAGSFGYEKEHYELSNKIGELVLFPEIRNAAEKTIIAAPGTSCRHHIKDGTARVALHPAVILYQALRVNKVESL